MILRKDGAEGVVLVVTHTTVDKIGSVIFQVAFVFFTRWYVSVFSFHTAGIYLVLFLLFVSFVSTALIFRTKVFVRRKVIRERRFRWKTVTLGDHVSVVTEYMLVRLRDPDGRLLYTFPSGLSHRGELEKQLRRLFVENSSTT